MHIYVNTLKCIEMTSKKEIFKVHKIFFNERCQKQPEGGVGGGGVGVV